VRPRKEVRFRSSLIRLWSGLRAIQTSILPPDRRMLRPLSDLPIPQHSLSCPSRCTSMSASQVLFRDLPDAHIPRPTEDEVLSLRAMIEPDFAEHRLKGLSPGNANIEDAYTRTLAGSGWTHGRITARRHVLSPRTFMGVPAVRLPSPTLTLASSGWRTRAKLRLTMKIMSTLKGLQHPQ
jgi:hypothetical protein